MPATGELPSKAMGRAAPSFRLRNSSLNAIRLRRIFDLFDQDGDGVITVAELDRALACLGLEGDAEEVRSTVSAHAKPGSAGLEYEDFESLHCELGDALFGGAAAAGGAGAEDAATEAELEEAFSVFDENGDGFISARELHAVLRKLGLLESGDMARVHQMILAVDDNRDGKVDFREFKRMMQGIVVRCI